MVEIRFDTYRIRPAALENQNCCYSDKRVREIDGKDEGALNWSDFEVIFPLSGCTAKYDQQVYYLPLALNFLLHHPEEGNEFPAGLVNFISMETDRLATDGLLHHSLDAMRSCFRFWTEQFHVVHFDQAACKAKGWRIDHSDYVRTSQGVRDLLDHLVRYETHRTIAEELVQSLVKPEHTPEASAWLLEIAKEARFGAIYFLGDYSSGPSGQPAPEDSIIRKLLGDRSVLQRCLDEIRETPPRASSCPVYWKELANELELAV